MKRIILLCFLITQISISNGQDGVVATASMISDMAQVIAGDALKVDCIVPIGGDPHLYEPTPADATLIYKAKLILKNGLTFEGWINELIETSGTKANVVTVTRGVDPIASLDYANATDPHAWMDLSNGLIYIENIFQSLVQLRPDLKETFEKNYLAYRKEIEETHAQTIEEIQKIPELQRVLITSHDAFQYYGKAYGLQLESILGTSTDAEVQTSDIINLNRVIRETGVPAIFVESTINPKQINSIAMDNNIVIGGELFADSIGDEESGADSYLDMIRHNTMEIVRGLSEVRGEETFTHSHGAKEGEKYRPFLFAILGLLFLLGFLLMYLRLRKTALATPPEGGDDKAAISVQGISVSYDQKVVLSNIYMEMEPGKVYGVVGPNGAGKSTLFKAILGLLEPDAGRVLVHGHPVDVQQKRVAYVPQKNDVDWNFPATVKDVVTMGRYPHLEPFSRVGAVDMKIAEEAMKDLGIAEFANRQIGALSGGQQQRVFLARALAQEADIFLLDEPFVGVDMTTEERIIELLKQLANEGKTLLVVHHDLSTVREYFDSVILLNQRLIAFGSTEETFTEENLAKAYKGQLTVLHDVR
ncbi:MAG: zinc ABC transporter solute-binding protein [Saprospiraceae bacterium]|nr:zinc ABC transporter solute-binding protein [Saprospiraceae bacterium]